MAFIINHEFKILPLFSVFVIYLCLLRWFIKHKPYCELYPCWRAWLRPWIMPLCETDVPSRRPGYLPQISISLSCYKRTSTTTPTGTSWW